MRHINVSFKIPGIIIEPMLDCSLGILISGCWLITG